MPNFDRYPCPCCGRLVHRKMPGFHQRCPVCGWEDDLAQLRFPLMPGSSNTVSLREAQQHVQAYGASEGFSILNADGGGIRRGPRRLRYDQELGTMRLQITN